MYRYGHLRIDQKATVPYLRVKEVMNHGAGGGIRTPQPRPYDGMNCMLQTALNFNYAAILNSNVSPVGES